MPARCIWHIVSHGSFVDLYSLINLWCAIGGLSYDQRLDQMLDADGVPKHLGQIADSICEWEGPIAEQLGLTPTDVAAINKRYPGELRLQT